MRTKVLCEFYERYGKARFLWEASHKKAACQKVEHSKRTRTAAEKEEYRDRYWSRWILLA